MTSKVWAVVDKFMAEEPLLLGLFTEKKRADQFLNKKRFDALEDRRMKGGSVTESLFGKFKYRPMSIVLTEVPLDEEVCGFDV